MLSINIFLPHPFFGVMDCKSAFKRIFALQYAFLLDHFDSEQIDLFKILKSLNDSHGEQLFNEMRESMPIINTIGNLCKSASFGIVLKFSSDSGNFVEWIIPYYKL